MSLSDRLAQARRNRSGTLDQPSSAGTTAYHRRQASVDPFAELKRTVHASLLESLGPQLYDSRLTEAELEQRWADALAATPVLAAFEGDAVVGLVLLAPCDDPDLEGENCAEIVELAVHPDATRRGHGSRLLAAAVDRARTD